MKYNLLTLALQCSFLTAFSQASHIRLNHTALFVTDLQRSTRFYHEIIGLDTIPEPFQDGLHTWLRTGPGTSLHIIQGAPHAKTYYKNHHTCFSVPSVETFTEVLRKNGINWEDVSGKKKTITLRKDGVQQIWLQDPDGYWIEVNDDWDDQLP